MGRSYAYECPRCEFKARVSGGPDRGILVWVQTIVCWDCKNLYDAVTRLKAAEGSVSTAGGISRLNSPKGRIEAEPSLSLQSILNRVKPTGVKRFRWFNFKLQCPYSPIHRVGVWNDPGKCPKCKTYLDKSALPFRLWE